MPSKEAYIASAKIREQALDTAKASVRVIPCDTRPITEAVKRLRKQFCDAHAADLIDAAFAPKMAKVEALVDEVATNLPSNEVVDTPHQHRVRTLFAALKEHDDEP